MNVYPFIEAERAQQRSVKRACELLEVSHAAYYTHRAGTLSARQRTDDELTGTSELPIRRPGAATAPHASTRSCGEAATSTGASASPG